MNEQNHDLWNHSEILVERVIKVRTIEDLSDVCLKIVFSTMSVQQKFAVLRVNRRWMSLMDEVFKQQTGFIFGENFHEIHRWIEKVHCSERFHRHYAKDEIIDNVEEVRLQAIAEKCKHIKAINFRIDLNQQQLLAIKLLFPTIECLRLVEKSTSIENPLNIGLHYGNTLRHLNINCRLITDEKLSQLIQNLPLLEELGIVQLYGSLQIVFQNLREGMREISIKNCNGFDANALNELNRRCGTSLIVLRYLSDNINHTINLFELVCTLLPNLRSLDFGYFHPPNNQRMAVLNRLTQLRELRVSYFAGINENWLQFVEPMPQIRKLDSFCAQMSAPIMEALVTVMPNLETLVITTSPFVFVCHCTPHNPNACQTCYTQILYNMSRLPNLKHFYLRGSVAQSRRPFFRGFRIFLRQFVNQLNFDYNSFPSLQRLSIFWKFFPRPLKRPIYDGMACLARRHPERLVVLETGVDLCRCHNKRLKTGWLSAIGRTRLRKIPPNLKLTFFRDIPL